MYSHITLTPASGRIFGAQSLSRSNLRDTIQCDETCPDPKAILYFEGANVPDAVKRKSPARDESWRFLLPPRRTDAQLDKESA